MITIAAVIVTLLIALSTSATTTTTTTSATGKNAIIPSETATSTTTTKTKTTIKTKEERLLFPGVYTTRYYDKGGGSIVEKLVRTVMDVIRIECDSSSSLEEEGTTTITTRRQRAEQQQQQQEKNKPKKQLCKADVLIRSEREFAEYSKSAGATSSSSSSQKMMMLLQYNSTLTERWIHPRMKVAEVGKNTTSKERRRRRRRRRKTQQQQQQRQPQEAYYDNNNNDDYYYSTIDSVDGSYECYYDYDGNIRWIEDFVSNHSPKLKVEWIDIGDSYLKTKFSNSDSNSNAMFKLEGLSSGGGGTEEEGTEPQQGHDIRVLTITGSSEETTTVKSRLHRDRPPSSSSYDPTNENHGGYGERTEINNNGSGFKKKKKSPFLIVSSTHPREYTPPELVRRWLERLILKVEENDPDFLSMMEQTTIHWIPYLNPDGRVLAETVEPFRRKNLNKEWTGNTKDSDKCDPDSYGVDLNRNMPFEWGKSDGSSGEACSNYAKGSGPGSEPESRALIGYASSIFPAKQQSEENAINAGGGDFSVAHDPQRSVETSSTKWKGYNPETTVGVFVDVHSYGSVYIYPWGNLEWALCPNDDTYRSVMGYLQSMTGMEAKGPGPNHYGVASGPTDDWAYGVLGSLSMTWELGTDFHEPCREFESFHESHFKSFEYLTKIAPRPYSLGFGPIVIPSSFRFSLVAASSADATNNNNGNNGGYHRDEDDDAAETGNDNSGGGVVAALYYRVSAVLSNGTTTRTTELSRMGNGIDADDDRNYEEIKISMKIELPPVLPETLDPIVFDADDDNAMDDINNNNKEETGDGSFRDDDDGRAFVTKIRLYYEHNPFAEEEDEDSANGTSSGRYWDAPVGTVFDRDHDTYYETSIGKDQLWSAFGSPRVDDTATTVLPTEKNRHMLYARAMNNRGQWGPVTATAIDVVLVVDPSTTTGIGSVGGGNNNNENGKGEEEWGIGGSGGGGIAGTDASVNSSGVVPPTLDAAIVPTPPPLNNHNPSPVSSSLPMPDNMAWSTTNTLDRLEKLEQQSSWGGTPYEEDAVNSNETSSSTTLKQAQTHAMREVYHSANDDNHFIREEIATPSEAFSLNGGRMIVFFRFLHLAVALIAMSL